MDKAYHSLDGTAMRHQVDHQRNSVGVRPMEGSAPSAGEGLATDFASVAVAPMTVNTDVALPLLTTCITSRVRAKYLLRVHGTSPELLALRDFTWTRAINHLIGGLPPFSGHLSRNRTT